MRYTPLKCHSSTLPATAAFRTLDAVCHRDAHGHVAGLDGPVRQALPLAADDNAQPAREIVARPRPAGRER